MRVLIDTNVIMDALEGAGEFFRDIATDERCD